MARIKDFYHKKWYNLTIPQAQKMQSSLLRKHKEKLLKKEILRTLLIPQEEKSFWLGKISRLPVVNVTRLLEQFQRKNQSVDRFIRIALENDPDHQYSAELKNILQQLRKNSFQTEEKQQHQNAESFLEENLSDV